MIRPCAHSPTGVKVPVLAAGRLFWHAMLPAGARRVELASRSFVPAWFARAGGDRRRLGIAVRDLRLNGRRLPPAAFGEGWHTAEPAWRWTNGHASVVVPRSRRSAVLAIATVAAGARYWEDAAGRAREARAGHGRI